MRGARYAQAQQLQEADVWRWAAKVQVGDLPYSLRPRFDSLVRALLEPRGLKLVRDDGGRVHVVAKEPST